MGHEHGNARSVIGRASRFGGPDQDEMRELLGRGVGEADCANVVVCAITFVSELQTDMPASLELVVRETQEVFAADHFDLRRLERFCRGLVLMAAVYAAQPERLPGMCDVSDQGLPFAGTGAQLRCAPADHVGRASALPLGEEDRARRIDVREGNRLEQSQRLGVECAEESLCPPGT